MVPPCCQGGGGDPHNTCQTKAVVDATTATTTAAFLETWIMPARIVRDDVDDEADEAADPLRVALLVGAEAWDAGLCVVRARVDGSKRPMGEWKAYQTDRPDRDTVDRWFRDGYEGIGVLCGATSGGLEMLEFEGRAVTDGTFNRFLEAADANGIGSLWDRISGGWSEITPSRGIHVYYLVGWEGDAAGNEKLAFDGGGMVTICTEF